MTRQEIKKKVYDSYPVTEKERSCWQEKQRRDSLRQILKNRLEQEAATGLQQPTHTKAEAL